MGNLLERCMTTFKDQERYRNDERYAKVWLHYVSHSICKLKQPDTEALVIAYHYYFFGLVVERQHDLKNYDPHPHHQYY